MKCLPAVLFSLLLSSAAPAENGQYLVVVDRFRDVMQEPGGGQPQTQVLYNDALVYKAENQEWYLVEVPGQKKYADGQWRNCSGWIAKKGVRPVGEPPRHDLAVKERAAQLYARPSEDSPVTGEALIGTRFGKTARQGGYYQVTLPDGKEGWIAQRAVYDVPPDVRRAALRRRLTRTARLLAGAPCRRGGMSAPAGERREDDAGLDSSGLVSLVFRVNGIDLPRDAQDQWRAAEQILVRSVKPGDLIFLSRKGAPGSIDHVMLYLGDDEFVEAPETGEAVRIGNLRERFGAGWKELIRNSTTADARSVYFGRVAELGYSGKRNR